MRGTPLLHRRRLAELKSLRRSSSASQSASVDAAVSDPPAIATTRPTRNNALPVWLFREGPMLKSVLGVDPRRRLGTWAAPLVVICAVGPRRLYDAMERGSALPNRPSVI